MPRPPSDIAGRAGWAWRQVRDQVYREETHCWLCGYPVDPGLHPNDPMARSADHLVQLCHGGHPTARAGLRLSHRRCNTARSNRLRGLAIEDCACSLGLPCAVLNPHAKRGWVSVSLGDL